MYKNTRMELIMGYGVVCRILEGRQLSFLLHHIWQRCICRIFLLLQTSIVCQRFRLMAFTVALAWVVVRFGTFWHWANMKTSISFCYLCRHGWWLLKIPRICPLHCLHPYFEIDLCFSLAIDFCCDLWWFLISPAWTMVKSCTVLSVRIYYRCFFHYVM